MFLILIEKHRLFHPYVMCNGNSGRCKYCIGFVSLIVFNVKCVNLVNQTAVLHVNATSPELRTIIYRNLYVVLRIVNFYKI